jgi:hypothetical protein
VLLQAANRETSRFPYKERRDMLGSSTRAGSKALLAINAAPRIAFRALNSVGIRNVISWLNTQPVVSPVNMNNAPSVHLHERNLLLTCENAAIVAPP